MLQRLRQQLAAHQARLSELLDVNDRDLTPDELREFDGLTGSDGDTSIAALQARIASVEETERRAAAAQAINTAGVADGAATAQRTTATVTVTAEPEVYRQGDSSGPSYFRDLMAVSLNRPEARAAGERLERSSRISLAGTQQRAISTTDGGIGEFVPPLWMVNEYIELARAGRVTADLCSQMPLPTGTDSINLPKITTGTSTAEQSTQNSAVSNTDMVSTSVPANVATIAGQQVVSVQLIEQSPINMDQVILSDLAADYAVRLDTFVISNNAAGKLGFLNVSGLNAVTYTDASPTVAELYPKLADGIQQINTNRYLPATAIVMHPRRWGWMLAAVDINGRPFVVPNAQGPNNSAGTQTSVAAQGSVGSLLGLPVYTDPNIPTNLGGGTNEDRIIIARYSDAWLMEGTVRTEAFRETKADQLSVLLRLYNYAAFTASRYAKSISVVSGTGLITPTF